MERNLDINSYFKEGRQLGLITKDIRVPDSSSTTPSGCPADCVLLNSFRTVQALRFLDSRRQTIESADRVGESIHVGEAQEDVNAVSLKRRVGRVATIAAFGGTLLAACSGGPYYIEFSSTNPTATVPVTAEYTSSPVATDTAVAIVTPGSQTNGDEVDVLSDAGPDATVVGKVSASYVDSQSRYLNDGLPPMTPEQVLEYARTHRDSPISVAMSNVVLTSTGNRLDWNVPLVNEGLYTGSQLKAKGKMGTYNTSSYKEVINGKTVVKYYRALVKDNDKYILAQAATTRSLSQSPDYAALVNLFRDFGIRRAEAADMAEVALRAICDNAGTVAPKPEFPPTKAATATKEASPSGTPTKKPATATIPATGTAAPTNVAPLPTSPAGETPSPVPTRTQVPTEDTPTPVRPTSTPTKKPATATSTATAAPTNVAPLPTSPAGETPSPVPTGTSNPGPTPTALHG